LLTLAFRAVPRWIEAATRAWRRKRDRHLRRQLRRQGTRVMQALLQGTQLPSLERGFIDMRRVVLALERLERRRGDAHAIWAEALGSCERGLVILRAPRVGIQSAQALAGIANGLILKSFRAAPPADAQPLPGLDSRSAALTRRVLP
jgi:hypothetical protein